MNAGPSNRLKNFLLLLLLGASLSASAEQALLDGTLHYRGFKIQEDVFKAFSGLYIDPNEDRNYLQAYCLQNSGEGALISVGTFRALTMAVLSNARETFQYDYDLIVTIFNYLNKALILRAQDHYEYLSYLFTGELQAQLYASVRAHGITDRKYVETLQALALSLTAKDYIQRLKNLRLELPRFSAAHAARLNRQRLTLSSYLADAKIPTDLLDFLLLYNPGFHARLKELAAVFKGPDEIKDNAFFGNPKLFARLRQMIQQGRLYILVADLLGSQAFPGLADALTRRNQPVKVLDTSNVLPWVIRDERHRTGTFFENLSRFPFSRNAGILMTELASDQGSDWNYFVFGPQILSSWKQLLSQNEATPKLRDTWLPQFGKPQFVIQNQTSLLALPRNLCP